MEPVAMTISHKHVAGVADVDAVGEVGDVLAADAAQELAVFVEHNDTVALE